MRREGGKCRAEPWRRRNGEVAAGGTEAGMEMLVHPGAGRGGRGRHHQVSLRGPLCARHPQQGEARTA